MHLVYKYIYRCASCAQSLGRGLLLCRGPDGCLSCVHCRQAQHVQVDPAYCGSCGRHSTSGQAYAPVRGRLRDLAGLVAELAELRRAEMRAEME